METTSTAALEPFSPTDGGAFRRLARRWAASVAVVTVRRGGAPDGFTATAVLAVSIDPPIVLVSATRDSSAGEMLGASEHFAINLLESSQRVVAEGFATPHGARGDLWASVEARDDARGVPLLSGALGAFSATVRQRVEAGDHVLVLGDVTAIHLGREGDALLYANRAYGAMKEEGGR